MKPFGNIKNKLHSWCEHQNLNVCLLLCFFLKVINEVIKIPLSFFARIYLGNEMREINLALYFPVLPTVLFTWKSPKIIFLIYVIMP